MGKAKASRYRVTMGEYKTAKGLEKGTFRLTFDTALGEADGGDLDAQMEYQPWLFAVKIVLRRKLVLIGWDEDIPFASPDDFKRVEHMRRLQKKLDTGTMKFVSASREQLAMARAGDYAAVCPNPGNIAPPQARKPKARAGPVERHPNGRVVRSDRGHNHHRPVTNPEDRPLDRPKRGILSAQFVTPEMERRAEAEAEPSSPIDSWSSEEGAGRDEPESDIESWSGVDLVDQ